MISSEEEKHKIMVYNVHENNLGESSQDIIGDAGKSTDYSSVINRLVEKAENQTNPIFEFPSGGGNYVKVPLSDPEISEANVKEIEDKIRLLSEEMNDIVSGKGFSIPRIEFYVYKDESQFLSKSGIVVTEPETKVTLEFEILYKNKNGRKGSYAPTVSCRRFKDLSPKDLIEMYAPYAEYSACAEKTISHKGPVVITGDALLDIFTAPEYGTILHILYISIHQHK